MLILLHLSAPLDASQALTEQKIIFWLPEVQLREQFLSLSLLFRGRLTPRLKLSRTEELPLCLDVYWPVKQRLHALFTFLHTTLFKKHNT